MAITNKKIFLSGAVCLLLLAACGEKSASTLNPTLPLKPCRVAFVENEVKCGTLEVIENRETAVGRKIALNIVVLPAIARNKEPDPIFVFAGGPGQAAGELAREAMAILGGLNGKRDIVLIDQRGTGKSNGLMCTFPDANSVAMNDPARRDALTKKTLIACRDKLLQKADLTQYTTTIAMADIDEVREALGYRRINLWGASYGTRAAMQYLRRYEDRVRSVVLDGVAPPSLMLPESFARDAATALEKMVLACEKDVGCGKQYARLNLRLDELGTTLAAKPLRISIKDPVTGIARDVSVTREMLLRVVFTTLYVPEMAALLPAAVAKAGQGDYAPLMALGAVFGDMAEEKLALGMQLSVVCAEDVPRIKQEKDSVATQPPPFGRMFVSEFTKSCADWPRGKMAHDFDQPVKSAKPVLILSGALDPVTPPQYGDEVSKGFSNVIHAVAPNVGHGVSIRGCAPKLIKKFIETAVTTGLDEKCLERMPRPLFYAPLREKTKPEIAENALERKQGTK